MNPFARKLALPVLLAVACNGGPGDRPRDSGTDDSGPAEHDTPDVDADDGSGDTTVAPPDAADAPDTVGDADDAADTGTGEPFFRQPWTVVERDWSTCPESEHATAQSLAEKAAYYQWLVPRIHRVSGRTEDGRDIVHALFHHTFIDAPMPGTIVPDDELPEVVALGSWGNAGLWTAQYAASQAFRYATARREGNDDEAADALAEVRITYRATYDMMRITGVPGLFARSYYSPLDVIGAHGTGSEDHAVTEGEFAGYTWVGDVSQDEYAGHMYALGIVAKLVDDEEVQAMARDIASQVGHHLLDHDLVITDVDGEPTTYGKMYALSLTHFPGYNAWLSLTWVKLAAEISGDPELVAFYEDCLLQRSGTVACIDQPLEQPKPYTEHFGTLSILQGCDTNHDSLSMAMFAAANLIWFEGDTELRRLYQRAMHDRLMTGDPAGRDPVLQANPIYNFMYAAFFDPDAEDATDPASLVRDAVCTLREFAPTNEHRGMDTTHYPEFCSGERHGSQTETPVPWRERDSDIFVFWFSPYERSVSGADPLRLEPPGDYLLAYWMGRYFGFVGPQQ